MRDMSAITDYIIGPVVFFIILFIARMHMNRKISAEPYYKYYWRGLFVKLLGGLGVWYIYTFYYPGGDTYQYYASALDTIDLFNETPGGFFSVWLGKHDHDKQRMFDSDVIFPLYYRDPYTYFVVRMLVPFAFFSFRSYIVCTFLLATVSFFGIWRLFKIYISEYPELESKASIAMFYIPSVFFWGSGIFQDTIPLSLVGFYVSAFYWSFIKRKKVFSNLVVVLLAAYIIISIKPYIFFGLIPGSLFWVVNRMMSGIKGQVLRYVSAPLLVGLISVFGYLLLLSLESSMGAYSLEKVLFRAVEVQKDLKSDFYQGNSFDIGEYDATITSMMAKIPEATNVALFRPYIWEANNMVMFLSSIENLILMTFTIFILIKTRLVLWLKFLSTNHLLTFSIIFSLFFAFSVGISSANFGSMVRYKIPAIPFFVCSLFIVQYLWNKEQEAKKSVKIKLKNPANETLITTPTDTAIN